MHRDILLTNRDAVTRWIDAYMGTLAGVREALHAEPADAASNLTDFFTEARDARAEWATQTTREGELLQGTGAELSAESLSDQMGRMLLGGFGRRRRGLAERASGSVPGTNQRPR